MATWMTHFRVADYFLDRIPGIVPEAFVVGNIGPDCGVPNEDWSAFTPPTETTHWREAWKDCRCEEFYAAYLDHTDTSPQTRSFLLGYYIHLVTDNEWDRLIYRPKKRVYEAEFEKDNDFIWTMKRDWYDLDHLYLKEHPDFRAFQIFSSVGDFRDDALSYFPEDAYNRKIAYITRFYREFDGDLGHEYVYLSKQEMDAFAEEAVMTIGSDLIQKGLTAVGDRRS